MAHDQRTAVKSMLARLGPHATAQQVLAAMEAVGVEISKRLVTQVKAELLRDAAQAEREQAKRPPGAKTRKRPAQRKIPGRRS